MKLGYSQNYHRNCEFYDEFKALWRLDDGEWLSKRKEAWRDKVKDEGVDPFTQVLGEFYVFGTEPASHIEDEETGERQRLPFEFYHRLAFTPFTTVDEVRDFWNKIVSQLGGDHKKHGKALYVAGALRGLPERDKMLKLITEALFCDQYFMVQEKLNGRKYSKTINPDDFLIGYSSVAFMFQDMEKYQWDYRCFTFDYFMKCVCYCDEHNVLDTPRSKKALPRMYETLLKQNDATLNSYRLELKQKLIAAAEASDAPTILREALEDAQDELKE